MSVRRSGVHSSISDEPLGDVEGRGDVGAPDLDAYALDRTTVPALACHDRARQSFQRSPMRPRGHAFCRIHQRRWNRNLLGALGRIDIEPHPAGRHRIDGREHAESAAFPRTEPGGAGENHLRRRDET